MSHDTTGVVLAGGRGQRMGGQDKGLLPWRGRPLAAWILDALRPQVTDLIVSANRNQHRYAELGVRVVADRIGGFAGPLAGLHAGLSAASTDWVLFTPCDALHLPPDLCARLHAAMAPGGRAAFATAGDEALYTCGLAHRSLAGAVATALATTAGSLRGFLSAQGAVAVDFPHWPMAGRNLNTSRDWDAIRLSA